MNLELSQEILALQAGDHLCLFYDRDPAEQMPALIPFIQEALARDEQFIYVADDHTLEELSKCLEAGGIDVSGEAAKGRLNLWTRMQWRQPGALSSENKAAQVKQIVRDGLAAGFSGVSFAVEMTWTLGPDISADQLEHWEATINTIFTPGFPGRIICQYNRSRLAPDTLMAGLHTHPVAILGDQVCPNPFYQAPLILKREATSNGNGHHPRNGHGNGNIDSARARVDWMISQLRQARRSEQRREELIRTQAILQEAEFSRERIEVRERRLAQVMEMMPAAVYTCDEEGRITYFNRVAAELWGRRPRLNESDERFCGSFRLWRPDGSLLPHDQTPMADAIRTGKALSNCEVVIERPDTSRITVNVCIEPLYDEKGQRCGAINVFQDITERKRASQTSHTLAAIVESSDDAIVSKDLNGIIMSWNRGAERLFGYTEKEMIGRSVTVLIPPERQSEEPDILARLQRGERIDHYETTRQRKDGTHVEISLTISPIRNADGKIVGASKIARDISERRRAEETLREVQDRLMRANEELEKRVAERTSSLLEAVGQMEEFSYSVSHDLRAPVRAMHGYAKVLMEDYGERLDGNGREYLDRIIRGGLRMDRLIQDILTYSRLSRREVQLQPVSLDKLVHEIVQQYPEMRSPHVHIAIIDKLESVIGHEPSLTQAISNLLNNAVKFVAPGTEPRVRVRTERRDSQVRLWVEDNGIGIKPEHQHRLFGMFERIHPERSYEGTGIGLAIVRKALERMGGRSGVESDGLTGSNFWIQLPATDET